MVKPMFLLLLCSTAAVADESRVALKEGPGSGATAAHCALCHSLDYITMNQGIPDRSGWEKTVGKMIGVMGAPIPEAERQAIIDYLAARYGK